MLPTEEKEKKQKKKRRHNYRGFKLFFSRNMAFLQTKTMLTDQTGEAAVRCYCLLKVQNEVPFVVGPEMIDLWRKKTNISVRYYIFSAL